MCQTNAFRMCYKESHCVNGTLTSNDKLLYNDKCVCSLWSTNPNSAHSSRRPKPVRRGPVAATEVILPAEGTNTAPSGLGRPFSKGASSASSTRSTPTPVPRPAPRAAQVRRTPGQQGGSMTEAIAVKRRQGYAAAEMRMRRRAVPVVTVEAGEMIGDVETVFRLDSYSETVVCTRPVQVRACCVRQCIGLSTAAGILSSLVSYHIYWSSVESTVHNWFSIMQRFMSLRDAASTTTKRKGTRQPLSYGVRPQSIQTFNSRPNVLYQAEITVSCHLSCF